MENVANRIEQPTVSFQSPFIKERLETARRETKVCCGCHRTGHALDVCRSKQRFPVSQCGFKHHDLIHSDTIQPTNLPAAPKVVVASIHNLFCSRLSSVICHLELP